MTEPLKSILKNICCTLHLQYEPLLFNSIFLVLVVSKKLYREYHQPIPFNILVDRMQFILLRKILNIERFGLW